MKPALIESCVGTWARVGCTTFHAQLRKAYFVTTLSVRASTHAYAIYRGSGSMPHVFVSGPRDMSMHDSKLPRQCPGMPGPSGAYACTSTHTMNVIIHSDGSVYCYEQILT